MMLDKEPHLPIRTKRTFEEISSRIKELIFEGTLKPGDKLPSENALAKKFHVGRQSIREALRLLELSGFIAVQKGVNGGPIIEDTMLNKMAGLFLDTFRFNKIPIGDLTAARKEIEKVILKIAIAQASESDIEALQANIRKAREMQIQGMAAFEENTEFHRILAKTSKNHVFAMVIEPILALESDFRSKFKNIDVNKSIKITQFHEEILNALIDGDVDRAWRTHESLVNEIHRQFVSQPRAAKYKTLKNDMRHKL